MNLKIWLEIWLGKWKTGLKFGLKMVIKDLKFEFNRLESIQSDGGWSQDGFGRLKCRNIHFWRDFEAEIWHEKSENERISSLKMVLNDLKMIQNNPLGYLECMGKCPTYVRRLFELKKVEIWPWKMKKRTKMGIVVWLEIWLEIWLEKTQKVKTSPFFGLEMVEMDWKWLKGVYLSDLKVSNLC